MWKSIPSGNPQAFPHCDVEINLVGKNFIKKSCKWVAVGSIIWAVEIKETPRTSEKQT